MWLVADPADPDFGHYAEPPVAHHPALRGWADDDDGAYETLPPYEPRRSGPSPPARAVSAPASTPGSAGGAGLRWEDLGVRRGEPERRPEPAGADEERVSGQFQEAISGVALVPWGGPPAVGKARGGSGSGSPRPRREARGRRRRSRYEDAGERGPEGAKELEDGGARPRARDVEAWPSRERRERWSAYDVVSPGTATAGSSAGAGGLPGALEGIVSPLSPEGAGRWRWSAQQHLRAL